MKTRWILPLLAGLFIGGGGVYFAMHDRDCNCAVVDVDERYETPFLQNPDISVQDPFESPGYGLILTDPNSVEQRHMCIALWYGEFAAERFGRAIGHEFGPIWNQRNPVEILEEHLEFMKKFMADTESLEKQDKIDSQKNAQEAEQAAPRNR